MNISLDPIFTDNMILQHGAPIPVRGTADPGAQVSVRLKEQVHGTQADGHDGSWEVILDPLGISAEPVTLIITAGSAEVSFRNMLVGDVWVCSGQSNMEWPVALALDAEREMAAADFPEIRLLSVPRSSVAEPAARLARADWRVCSPGTIRQSSGDDYPLGFSAVGYYFGREIHRRLGIPIGLINSSVGGTCAEAWTSRSGLLFEASTRKIWETHEQSLLSLPERQAEWDREMETIAARTRDVTNLGIALGYAAPGTSDADWCGMEIPAKWQGRGLNFNGVVWFRKAVHIPAEWAGKPLQLSLGAVDKSDTTYFNGEKIGGLAMQDRSDAWCIPRVYTVPGNLVRPDSNVIAVRVHSDKYDGGMTGPATLMSLSCPEIPDGEGIPLEGTWLYTVEVNYGAVTFPPQPLGPGNANMPTGLFNGMIAPLGSFPIKGVIWYQGESNADRASEYRELFPALIRSWRKHWGQEDIPFHFVQLANYRDVAEHPGESSWAELREAQTRTLQLPHTGMAVAIDAGEALDIHPRNKQAVGHRLASGVLHGVYGRKEIVPCGPLFRELRPEGDAIRIFFDFAGPGLVCQGETLEGFALAGADKAFVWAQAEIEGDTVLVHSPAVPEPKFVRYAWSDNPRCNLYNAAGFPASPFRACLDEVK